MQINKNIYTSPSFTAVSQKKENEDKFKYDTGTYSQYKEYERKINGFGIIGIAGVFSSFACMNKLLKTTIEKHSKIALLTTGAIAGLAIAIPSFKESFQSELDKENKFKSDPVIYSKYKKYEEKKAFFNTIGFGGIISSLLCINNLLHTNTEKLPKIALMATGAIASLGSAILLFKASFEVDKPKK